MGQELGQSRERKGRCACVSDEDSNISDEFGGKMFPRGVWDLKWRSTVGC